MAANKEELEQERQWFDNKCIFKIGDVIEWTDCIAVIIDIMVSFPKGYTKMNNFEGVDIIYELNWIAHPQLEAQERLSHKFTNDEAKAYNIKLASERWQVLYGKTKV